MAKAVHYIRDEIITDKQTLSSILAMGAGIVSVRMQVSKRTLPLP